MFSLAVVQDNPLTNEPALWFYSPRCSLSCKTCVLPFRTEQQYSKLDIVREIRKYRDKISSVVFYLGDMQQKAYILIKYFSVVRSTWKALSRYICFAIPNVRTLWKFLIESHIDGIIYDIHWPLTVPSRSNVTPGLIKVTGCNERQYLQSLFTFHALKSDPSALPHTLRCIYNPSKLKSPQEIAWHKTYFS